MTCGKCRYAFVVTHSVPLSGALRPRQAKNIAYMRIVECGWLSKATTTRACVGPGYVTRAKHGHFSTTLRTLRSRYFVLRMSLAMGDARTHFELRTHGQTKAIAARR